MFNTSQFEEVTASYSKERKKNAMLSLIKGFESAFVDKEMPPQSQALYNKMIEHYVAYYEND